MNDDSTSRIAAELERWVADAPAGSRLPSSRELVRRHAASPVTVQRALRALTAKGLIEARPGVGTFVRATSGVRAHDFGWQTSALGTAPRSRQPSSCLLPTSPEEISLNSGYPAPELLPETLVRSAFTRAVRQGAAFTRPSVAGFEDLRAWFAAELAEQTRGGMAPPRPSDVIITPGSQTALATIFRALLAPGEPLVVESPTYWGAIDAAALAGVRLVPVASGSGGPDPDELERAVVSSGARLFFAQPSFANPSGALWGDELAERVLQIARRHGVFVIEDDWAHDFAISADLQTLAGRDDSGHVIRVRSLTKSTSPAIRVAGVIARGPVQARILSATWGESMYVSPVLQSVALDVISRPGWRTHLSRMRRELGDRRDLMVRAVTEHADVLALEQVPHGGLHLWVRLPEGVDTLQVQRACADERVLVGPGTEWFPAEAPGSFVRLNFSGPDPGSFPRGVEVLADVVRRG